MCPRVPSRKPCRLSDIVSYHIRGSIHGCSENIVETIPEATYEISMILYMASESKVSSASKAIIATKNAHVRPIETLRKSEALSD